MKITWKGFWNLLKRIFLIHFEPKKPQKSKGDHSS